MESLSLLNAVALLAVGGVLGCALSALVRISGRQRRARDEIARDMATAEQSLEQAWRLRDVEKILREDPKGSSIDPLRDPTLHRIFLLHSGRLTPTQFAAEADREAALDRIAADVAELRILFEGDQAGLLAAWRRRFGSEPEAGELERLITDRHGESVA